MFRKLTPLRRATVRIVALLLLCSAVAFIGVHTARTLLIPWNGQVPGNAEDIVIDRPDIASFVITEKGLQVTAEGTGEAEIHCGDDVIAFVYCRNSGFVFDNISMLYTGEAWVQFATLFFLAGTSLLLGLALWQQTREMFFHYATPLITAFLLLSLMSLVCISLGFTLPGNQSVEYIVCHLPSTLLMIVMPFLLLFTLSMLVSNISLLKHEGRTWRNLLGSLIGFGLTLVTALVFFNSNASGSLEEIHLHDLFLNLVSGLVLWTECKLTGIILCGVRAAKHEPSADKDYVLILGCRLSRKGGLTPLLRGRVDRALQFARKQKTETGHMPVLIPCGGKGKDELRSEAAAMHEYLLEQGIPEEGMLTEDRSENTWENMRNAQSMMKPDAKVAYATTNYHVFRAGVWAARNGLYAEGMGSHTKWYYWPNAFMREYVALVSANFKHELNMLILIAVQSGLLAYLYH